MRILGFHLEPVQNSLQGGLTRLVLYGEWKKEYTGQRRLSFSWEWESWKVRLEQVAISSHKPSHPLHSIPQVPTLGHLSAS